MSPMVQKLLENPHEVGGDVRSSQKNERGKFFYMNIAVFLKKKPKCIIVLLCDCF